MNKNKYNFFNSSSLLLVLLAAAISLLLFTGCAGGTYGKMDRDRDLDNMFLDYEVLPGHRYYITGGYAAPRAILAVQNDYELDNPGNLWVPVPGVNSGQMRRWIDTIAPVQNYRYSGAYFAAYILNPEGKRVGAWFATENQTTVKFLAGNRIVVYPPNSNQDFLQNRGLRRKGDY